MLAPLLALLPILALAQRPTVPRVLPPSAMRHFSPALLDSLKISRKRVISARGPQRQWVLPKGDLLPNIPNLPYQEYLDMTATVYPKIRQAGLEIESQGSRGTCTIFATKFLAEFEIARQRNWQNVLQYNAEYLNWAANKAEGYDTDGSSFPAVIAGLDKYGCTLATDPKLYDGKIPSFDPKYTPSVQLQAKGQLLTKRVALLQIWAQQNHTMSDEQMEQVMSLLKAGTPVAVGQEWPASGAWKSTKVGDRTVVEGTGAINGAHTMAIVGYKKTKAAPGGGYFMFRNSWGTKTNNDGYLMMSFDWIKHHTYDACIAVPVEWIG